MFVLPFLIWRPVFLPTKIEANWLLSSSAHSLLMFPVFYLLTWYHTSPCHLTLVHVHLKANVRNGVPPFSSFPVQVASYCDFLISFDIPHPTIHPLSQKHLPGFLPFPHLLHRANQLSIPAPVYLTDPSCLPHAHCHHCSCTFVSSLLYLALLSLPATTSHTVNTSLMWSCPFLRGFMAIICLQEKVQTSFKNLWLPSVCAACLLPLLPPPHILSQPIQLLAVLHVTFSFPSVLWTCFSHCMCISLSSHQFFWPGSMTPLRLHSFGNASLTFCHLLGWFRHP